MDFLVNEFMDNQKKGVGLGDSPHPTPEAFVRCFMHSHRINTLFNSKSYILGLTFYKCISLTL